MSGMVRHYEVGYGAGGAMSVRLEDMRKAYDKWAPIYDLVYDGLTAPARRSAVKAALSNGRRILEVGVGTGLSLRDYPRDAEIYGVDLSFAMLKRARQKVRRRHLTHVKLIASMDACRLGFRDESFDAVVAQFVITLVPHPERALDEMARVLRPGGEIILTNHLGAEQGLQAVIEEKCAGIAKRIGWSTEFKLSRIESWAERSGMIEAVSAKDTFPVGFFKVIRLRKPSDSAMAA
jgi:phosphatidylethanolamine/phosphatidyl-N-methylethanolamine N-methyltransferase